MTFGMFRSVAVLYVLGPFFFYQGRLRRACQRVGITHRRDGNVFSSDNPKGNCRTLLLPLMISVRCYISNDMKNYARPYFSFVACPKTKSRSLWLDLELQRNFTYRLTDDIYFYFAEKNLIFNGFNLF
jgi:hypothetical protein